MSSTLFTRAGRSRLVLAVSALVLSAGMVSHAQIHVVRVETLPGQAHEGMTTAPDQYVASILGFLTPDERGKHACA